MTILITGGTGRVGGATIAKLVAEGHSLRVLSRSEERLKALPPGVVGMVGDLDDPSSLAPALQNVRTVLISLLVHPDEGKRGVALLEAAYDAGVRKIVHISVKHYPGSETLPFYMGKQLVEREIKRRGFNSVIIRPANFHQSDSAMKAFIIGRGLYPPPIGTVGIDRIDSRDVGYAAARALVQSDFDGQEAELYGPETFTGPSVAAVWSAKLGRSVAYMGDDIDNWARENSPRLPAFYINSLRGLYQQQQKYGMRRPEGEASHALLPATLRTFETYADEQIMSWKV